MARRKARRRTTKRYYRRARRARRNPVTSRARTRTRTRTRYVTRYRSRARRNPVKRYRRHRVQRNPKILGLQLPSLNDFLFTGLGFAAAPGIEGFLSSYIPTDLTANTAGRYAVKIGSVGLTAWAVRKFVGAGEGNRVMLGGAIYIAMAAIREFMPGVIPGLGAYVPIGGMGEYVTPLTRRVGMGAYTSYRNLGYAGAGVPVMPAGSRQRRAAQTVSRFSRFQ